jgi:hypothetical protein
MSALRASVHWARQGLATAVLALLMTGCAQPFLRTVEIPAIPAPLVGTIPLVIGVHYSPALRTARRTSRMQIEQVGTIEESWLVGEPGVAALDRVLRATFRSVVEIQQWPHPNGLPEVAGILVPSMAADAVEVRDAGISVRFRIDLYASTGQHIGGWEIVGESGTRSGEPGYLVRSVTLARESLRTAGASLAASFFRHPVARSWLAANGVRPDALLEASSSHQQGNAVVALRVDAGRPTEDRVEHWLARCVAAKFGSPGALGGESPAGSLRDALFPWLDRGIAPKSAAELAGLLETGVVRERLKDLRIRYLAIFARGFPGTGPMGDPRIVPSETFWGLREWHGHSLYAAIWDLRERRIAGAGHAHWSPEGQLSAAIGPQAFLYFGNQTETCDEVARFIGRTVNVAP